MTKSKRILILDPYGVYSLPTADVLAQAGHEYTLVWDRPQALQALQVNSYDLIIVDVRLPAEEMLEVRHMAHQTTPPTPVLLYTRNPSLLKVTGERQGGMNTELCKLVTPDRLLEEIEYSMTHLPPAPPVGKTQALPGATPESANRVDQLTQALEETIQVIESTRRSFKSKELAALRKKLEQVLARDWGR